MIIKKFYSDSREVIQKPMKYLIEFFFFLIVKTCGVWSLGFSSMSKGKQFKGHKITINVNEKQTIALSKLNVW